MNDNDAITEGSGKQLKKQFLVIEIISFYKIIFYDFFVGLSLSIQKVPPKSLKDKKE